MDLCKERGIYTPVLKNHWLRATPKDPSRLLHCALATQHSTGSREKSAQAQMQTVASENWWEHQERSKVMREGLTESVTQLKPKLYINRKWLNHDTLRVILCSSENKAPSLPPEKSVCRSRSNSQNWTWNNRLTPIRERSMSRLYIVTLLI